MRTITLDTMLGDHFGTVSTKAIKMASERHCAVTFNFNGVGILVNPESTIEACIYQYNKGLDDSKEYLTGQIGE